MKNKASEFSQVTKRQFMRQLVTALSAPIVFLDKLPAGLIPEAIAQEANALDAVPDYKKQLSILSDRPPNAETPAHLLDDEVTPNHLHFVRNNGHIPERARTKNLEDWKLQIDGEVGRSRRFSLEELQNEFKNHEAQITIECAGNGRAGYYPNASGNQWTLGAAG